MTDTPLWRGIDGNPPPPFDRLRRPWRYPLWRVFCDYYVPRLPDEREQRHAAAALVRAIEREPEAMEHTAGMRRLFATALDPFLERQARRERAIAGCDYCGRPTRRGEQCAGCGAWRKL